MGRNKNILSIQDSNRLDLIKELVHFSCCDCLKQFLDLLVKAREVVHEAPIVVLVNEWVNDGDVKSRPLVHWKPFLQIERFVVLIQVIQQILQEPHDQHFFWLFSSCFANQLLLVLEVFFHFLCHFLHIEINFHVLHVLSHLT
jgi:hypothetical protein